MKKEIIILGSTGSIGKSILNIIRKNKKNFIIKVLTTNNNISLIYNQAIKYNVKNVVIINSKKFDKYKEKFKKKKLMFFLTLTI
mgnify:FL=1